MSGGCCTSSSDTEEVAILIFSLIIIFNILIIRISISILFIIIITDNQVAIELMDGQESIYSVPEEFHVANLDAARLPKQKSK